MATIENHGDGCSIQLRDGRRLGYREIGAADGTPIVFFHGTPGSRFCLSEQDAITHIPGTRWILPERPGYGLSDPCPERRLKDWPSDVEQLADALDLDTFIVSGGSGGGPHALACARFLGRRVSACLTLASPSPLDFRRPAAGLAFGNAAGIWLTRFAPWAYRKGVETLRRKVLANPHDFIEMLKKQVAEPDARLVENPEYAEDMLRDVVEAYRQGWEAHASDGRISIARDWGFALQDIDVPVYGWYGAEDTLVSLKMTKYLTDHIRTMRMTIVENAGHLLTDHRDVVAGISAVLAGEEPKTRHVAPPLQSNEAYCAT